MVSVNWNKTYYFVKTYLLYCKYDYTSFFSNCVYKFANICHFQKFSFYRYSQHLLTNTIQTLDVTISDKFQTFYVFLFELFLSSDNQPFSEQSVTVRMAQVGSQWPFRSLIDFSFIVLAVKPQFLQYGNEFFMNG